MNNKKEKKKSSLSVIAFIMVINFLLIMVILWAVAYSSGIFDEFKDFDPEKVLSLEALANGETMPPEPTPIPEPTATPEPTPEPTPTPVPTPTPLSQIGATLTQERKDLLVLVNKANPIADDYQPNLVDLPLYTEYPETGKEVYIDARVKDNLYRMLDDCKAAGFNPYVCSGYRTIEYQTELFDNKVANIMNTKMLDYAEAKIEASSSVALPGTSEHHLGLAADIIDYDYPHLNSDQENTGTQQWLMANSWKYGFILRYPADKSDTTYIIYEPWHYRYVGVENAASIHESGLCLEEYLEQIGI